MLHTDVPPDPAAYRPYRPWIAFLLSLPGLGLGHLYVGRPRRAWAALAFSWFLLFPAATLLLLLMIRSVATYFLASAITLALYLLVPIDAALCARRSRMHAQLSRLWWVHFAGLFLVGAALFLSRPVWLVPLLPFHLSRIPTGAMIPTILIGDYVVSDRRSSTVASVAAGDLVVFRGTEEPGKEYLKRLVGLPGEMIEVRGGRLFVNGTDRSTGLGAPPGAAPAWETLGTHEYQIRVTRTDCIDWGPAKVPENSLFMLGDNRCNSMDSRSYGAIPRDHVLGRAVRIEWSEDPGSANVRWKRFGLDLAGH